MKLRAVPLLLLAAHNAVCYTEEEWTSMPGGITMHTSCIHHFDEPFTVESHPNGSSSVHFESGRSSVQHEPCPYASSRSEENNVGYYSSWVAYAQTTQPSGYSALSNTWTVPAKPTYKGPAPPLVASSVYLFNGLEDGGGVSGAASVIIQPVLQFGKSGCLLNPLKQNAWYLTSYLVNQAGRAYCGKNLGPLKEGEQVAGNMTLLDADTQNWEVLSTRLSDGSASRQTASLGNNTHIDSAYLTLEMMVVYKCAAYPASGSVAFEDTVLLGADGRAVAPKWESKIKHDECAQAVNLGKSPEDAVSIVWDPTL